jgi:hypothetical protein
LPWDFLSRNFNFLHPFLNNAAVYGFANIYLPSRDVKLDAPSPWGTPFLAAYWVAALIDYFAPYGLPANPGNLYITHLNLPWCLIYPLLVTLS